MNVYTLTESHCHNTHIERSPYIFHVVLDSVLLQVGGGLCSVEPLGGVHVGLLKVLSVNLQLVVRV